MHVKHKNQSMPSIDLIRQRVDYDPATGIFTWKPCGIELFKNFHGWRVWHGKFGGKPVMKRNRGYVIITITVDGKERYVQAHRAAWALMTGAWPDVEIDHKNTDRGDNRFDNLREANHQQNQCNKPRAWNNKSGFKGVHFNKSSGKWVSQITRNKHCKNLGSFDSPETASLAYAEASKQLHGEFAFGDQQ